jgi:DNA-binding NarL/FixJ family response regulator
VVEMKRILVVDRHDLFRESLAHVLGRSLDVEVAQSRSIAEARDLLAAEAVDLALVEVEAPNGDGSRLVGELRRANPRVPVLTLSMLLSPLVDPSWTDQALEAGADGVISKTASIEELVDAVRHLV